ncbi:MAG TPA: hypothetical protein ENJ83_03470 [Rhodospirillales bacterium]|nr:hypothetical protein [Rhodospirillales bacterium]
MSISFDNSFCTSSCWKSRRPSLSPNGWWPSLPSWTHAPGKCRRRVARSIPCGRELIAGRFVDEKVAVLIAGPCGTGKSHIARAIRHAAVRQGYDVLFTSQSRPPTCCSAPRSRIVFAAALAALCSTGKVTVHSDRRKISLHTTRK